MIPKKIHYCWFGRNPKPELIEKCILSWKKYCPDWEIIEWNEDNFDISSVPYMQEAYNAKKWAFVSDVARLLIIWSIGGIYLDTDVELLKSINELLENQAFFAFETSRNIASGLGFGAIKGHKAVKAMLDVYKDKHFLVNGVQQLIPCPAGNTEAMGKCCPAFARNGNGQIFDGVRVLSGKEYAEYAVHHGTATWVSGPRTKQKHYKSSKLKSIFRNPRYFEKVEKLFGKKAICLYTWLVYDLMEFGLFFYMRKIFYKVTKSKAYRKMNFVKEFVYRLRGEYTTEKLISMGMKVGKNFGRLNGVILDPSHCWLIEIGDNVTLASRVHILCHDASTKQFLNYTKIGSVTIGSNVFIGAESVVLPGVTIGNNVIIGANSTVTHDVPSNTVYAGSPAKMLCTLDEYLEKEKKRMQGSPCYDDTYTLRKNVSMELRMRQKRELTGKMGYID